MGCGIRLPGRRDPWSYLEGWGSTEISKSKSHFFSLTRLNLELGGGGRGIEREFEGNERLISFILLPPTTTEEVVDKAGS